MDALRARIDRIDAELLSLFEARMDVSAQIGAYKCAHDLPIEDKAREERKLKSVASQVRPELSSYAQELYRALFALSKAYQQDLNNKPCARAGLLGRKLAHSFSPLIHTKLAPYSYALFEIEPEQLASFLCDAKFDALNVTMPYKKAVLPYCSALSPAAAAIGSANTLIRAKDGTLHADNTDAAGFQAMLHALNLEVRGKKALVLGSGGASLTVQYVLREMGAREIVVISRTGENNYGNIELHADAQLLINTTPVGMYPKCDAAPLSLEKLIKLEAVLDLIYNPLQTRLLQDARARGIPCLGGLTMLVEQARAAAELFTGHEIPKVRTQKIQSELKDQMQSIYLIGMPGCGKSSIGRALADKMQRKFIDVDIEIERELGVDIPTYLSQNGEDAFRQAETRVLKRLGMEHGAVIACGGGCVTRAENLAPMRQNGLIFYLQRALDLLPTKGRPLSQRSSVQELFAARKPLYEAFADACIDNSYSIEHAVQMLEEVYYEISHR